MKEQTKREHTSDAKAVPLDDNKRVVAGAAKSTNEVNAAEETKQFTMDDIRGSNDGTLAADYVPPVKRKLKASKRRLQKKSRKANR